MNESVNLFRSLRIPLALVALTGLVACQTAPSVTPGVSFNVAQAESVGVRGIYQEADKTFLLFAHFVPAATKIYGPKGQRLPVARSGRLIGVTGQHERIGVRLGGAMAVAHRMNSVATESTMPSAVWADRQSIVKQLEQLGDNSNVDSRLKSTSDRTVGLLRPTSNETAGSPTVLVTDEDQQVIAFDGNSLEPKSQAAVLAAVHRANEATGVVTIRGVVSSGATLRELVMAKKRAKHIRSMMVSQGVAETRAVVSSARKLSDGENPDAGVTVSFSKKAQ